MHRPTHVVYVAVLYAMSDIAEGSSVWENYTFSKILQPHLLSRSRAVTSYKRRHVVTTSALQRLHYIYWKALLTTNFTSPTRRGRTSRPRNIAEQYAIGLYSFTLFSRKLTVHNLT